MPRVESIPGQFMHRTCLNNEYDCEKPHNPEEASTRSLLSAHLSESPCEYGPLSSELIYSLMDLAVPSPDQADSERYLIQRKRRKTATEGAHREQLQSQSVMNASSDESLGNVSLRNSKGLHEKHRNAQKSLSSHEAFRNDPKNRSLASPLCPARQQKYKSQTHDHPRRNRSDTPGVPQVDEVTFTRRRLIDSLGAADECTTKLLSPNEAHGPSQLSPGNTADEAETASAASVSSKSTHKAMELGIEHPGRRPFLSTATPLSMLKSSSVTYSRQRSFLNDTLDHADADPLRTKLFGGLETPEKSNDVKSPQFFHGENENHDTKPVRSIHELRQAGDNARFRGDVESIFEEIESLETSTSGRCCGLAELCDKFLDSRYVRRFCEQGFDERLVNCTQSAFHCISASLELSAYKSLLTSGHASRVYSEALWGKILELVPPLLDIKTDLLVLARRPPTCLSRTAQASIGDIRPRLLALFGLQSLCLSPQLLALECMRASLVVLRHNGLTINPLSTSFLARIVDLMVENTSMASRTSSSKNQAELLNLLFLILENYSVISRWFDHHHRQCLQRLSQLNSVLTLDNHDRPCQLAISYIRVILNLTNKEPLLCDSYADPDILSGLATFVTRGFCHMSGGFLETDKDTLNMVILSLGALINLAEGTEKSRATLIRCDGHTNSFFDQLLEQFLTRLNSMDQVSKILSLWSY